MVLDHIRAFYTGTISAGSSYEKVWTPSRDIHIHKILFVDRSALDLSAVDVYIKIGDDVITRDQAPASVFGQDNWVSIPVDVDVKAGTTIYFKITNNDSVDHDLAVVFINTK